MIKKEIPTGEWPRKPQTKEERERDQREIEALLGTPEVGRQDQPKPTGDWTPDSVAILNQKDAAHAVERDKANVRETELICERDYFKKELDAERGNRESIESINKLLARTVVRLRQRSQRRRKNDFGKAMR